MRQQKGQNENRHRQKAMYIRQSHKTLIKQSSVPFGYETMGVASVTMAPNSDTASGKTKYCLSIGASISASKLSNSLAFLESNRLAAQHNNVVHNNREQWIKPSRLQSQTVKPQIQ